jgi:hypothetical protein
MYPRSIWFTRVDVMISVAEPEPQVTTSFLR